MNPDQADSDTKRQSLREHAEDRLLKISSRSPLPEKREDIQRLVHELQVHRVELELQNEELTAARNDLEALLERYTELYDFAPIGYFSLDRNGSIREVNQKGITMLGNVRSLIIGRKFQVFVAGESLPEFNEFLSSLFDNQGTEIRECEVTLLTMPPIMVSVKAVIDEPRNQCFIAVTDISARKSAEAAREQLLSDLKRKNQELEQFTYVVSHDLKSPIISVRGFLSYAEKKALSGDIDGFKANIARVHAAIDKMEQFMHTLLELSRIGRVCNPPTLVPLSRLIQDSVDMLTPQIQARGVEMVVPDRLPDLYGDKARLQQVITNLIGNAVKFMGDQKKPEIEISATVDKGFVTVCIRDNGIGIRDEDLEQIFSNVTRLNPDIPGSGYGLTIIRRIIEVHGGRCWAESQGLGKGSSFCFRIPENRSDSARS